MRIRNNRIIYPDNLTGIYKKALEVLSAIIVEQVVEYPACVKASAYSENKEFRDFFIGTKENNPFVKEFSKANLTKNQEYAIYVTNDRIIIEGFDDAGVLYGCVDFYSKYLRSSILSHELTVKEISEICKNVDMELGVTAYGYLELMICENCPIKAMGKCQNHRPVYKLKDRMNESFPLVCTDSCQLKLLNSKPLFMADKLEDLRNIGLSFINLDFTVENADETEKIIKLYMDALSGKSVSSRAENSFTRGHFYRGIK